MHKQTVKMGVRNENKAAALQFPTSCQDTERSVLLLFCLKVCDGLVFYYGVYHYRLCVYAGVCGLLGFFTLCLLFLVCFCRY